MLSNACSNVGINILTGCFSFFVWFSQENVKYLPGIKLPKNVVADPDIEHAGINFQA